MATRRIIKGVLGNFLGTFVSRYSDYKGFLLFGYLVGDFDELKINLLGERVYDRQTPIAAAVDVAIEDFEDQRSKAGLLRSRISEATLTIRQLPGSISGAVNRHPCSGFNVSFLAVAAMDDGKRFQRERIVFIAPHEAIRELKSTRPPWEGI